MHAFADMTDAILASVISAKAHNAMWSVMPFWHLSYLQRHKNAIWSVIPIWYPSYNAIWPVLPLSVNAHNAIFLKKIKSDW